ncbi:MAG: glycoside hydrolase family 97 N-terminal domain-containing protein, partial [Myxococcota bacterium]
MATNLGGIMQTLCQWIRRTTLMWCGLVCIASADVEDTTVVITSPDKALRVEVANDALGRVVYRAQFHGEPIILESGLGFRFQNYRAFEQPLRIGEQTRRSVDQT